jgi:hypothetical protein
MLVNSTPLNDILKEPEFKLLLIYKDIYADDTEMGKTVITLLFLI